MRACSIGVTTHDSYLQSRFAKKSRTRSPSPERTNPGRTSVMSLFPTCKGGHRLERLRRHWHVNMAVLLEVDPDVLSWTTKATALRAVDDAEELNVSPDFWVEERGGHRAVMLLRDEKARERFFERHASMGHRFVDGETVRVMTLTRDELDTHPHLPAARTILYYRHMDVAEEHLLQVAAMVPCPPATIGLLWDHLGRDRIAWTHMLALVGKGAVEVEMSGQLECRTPVIACKAVEVSR